MGVPQKKMVYDGKSIYIYIYIYTSVGKFNHDQTLRPKPGVMVDKGNHPQMALIQASEML